ncbi:phage protein NinX family protein [Providencia stuartii]|uniref:phage protein NinX family protein n=1 Tax=Providencia stuartii TaxID=588 RepID=UPI001BCF4E98|nr:phage protein NinX family protein [Providencia thailandensis]MBS7783765.1 DUF2591 family protein [Providencia thailandensis]
MNKYTELSDFEINKKVAEKLGLNFKDGVIVKNGEWFYFDPCNNPADAMPIINEYGISLIYQDRKFQFATNDGNIECCIANPLKAAMIIFLCMKDAENEKV